MVFNRVLLLSGDDVGQAAVMAWDVFKVAAGEDAGAWDMASATAEIRPEEKARLTATRHCGIEHSVVPVASGGGWLRGRGPGGASAACRGGTPWTWGGPGARSSRHSLGPSFVGRGAGAQGGGRLGGWRWEMLLRSSGGAAAEALWPADS